MNGKSKIPISFYSVHLEKNGNGRKCYPENELINSKLVFDPLNLDQKNTQADLSRYSTKSLLRWINRNIKRRNYQYLDYEKILTTLSNCEISLHQSQQMLLLNQYEINNYLKLYHKIVEAVIEAESKLLLCKQSLKNSESQSSAYRLETLRNLSKLETEIGNLNSIKEDLCFKLAKRQKQCSSLFNTAQNLQTLFAKEENTISNAIENHVKTKQRQLLKQHLMSQGFMKNEFNNILADSIVTIDQQTPNNLTDSTISTTILPNNLNHPQLVNTTANLNSSMFKRSNSNYTTSILQKDNSDSGTEFLTQIKMPKIFLRDVSGKFITVSKQMKNFGKESNNKINIKLNKLHFINNGVQSSLLSNKLSPVNTNNYKVFDMNDNQNSMISCR